MILSVVENRTYLPVTLGDTEMLKQVFWKKGKPSGFACFYALALILAAVAGYGDGPQIAADAKRVYEARLAAEEIRRATPIPTPQPPACQLDPTSSIWCVMGRFYVPN